MALSLTKVYGNFRQTYLLLLKKRKIFISLVTFFFFLISFSWKNCILAETTEGELDKKLFNEPDNGQGIQDCSWTCRQ